MKTTLDFITLGAEVRRYHTLTTLREETVGHHSHGVALLCVLLTDGLASAELLMAALLHDLAEQTLGDIPSPAKRQLGFGRDLARLEDRLISESTGLTPLLDDGERRTLKLADIAQGALFCAREMELGNARMRVVFDRYMLYAEEHNPVNRERELFDVIKEIAQ